MNKHTQDDAVLNWLKEFGCIEPMQALGQLGCYRLSAVIHRLRNLGHDIKTIRITRQGRFGKVSFAQYYLKNKS